MRFVSITSVILALLAAPVFSQTTPASSEPPILEAADVNIWLDGMMPYALQSSDIAGAVVTIVADGQIITQRGFGLADVVTNSTVDPAITQFRIGSISKLFTWTAVMQLVEQGKLDLDADINTYIDFTIPLYEGQPITLRNLLTHTAGFEEQFKNLLTSSAEENVDFGETLKTYVPARIYAPGTTPAYSNYGASLAGYIVKRASGLPFDQYVQDNILTPLDMNASTFTQPLPEGNNLATGYVTATGEVIPYEFVGPSPAGSMTSTSSDMAQFMLAHLNGGAIAGRRILQPETAELMHTRALQTIPSLNGMALGFYEASLNGHRIIGHGGDTNAFHSDLSLFIDDGVGIFVSFNSAGDGNSSLTLRSLLFSEFADRYFPATDASPLVDIEAGNAKLLAGQWLESRHSESNFLSFLGLISQTTMAVDEDGNLMAGTLMNFGPKVPAWIEIEPLVWQASIGHERLSARVVDGKAIQFSMNTIAPIMVYNRVPWYKSATWLVPALIASLTALLLTAIHWPAAALMHHKFNAKLNMSGTALLAYRGVRISAWVFILTLAGWFMLVLSMFTDMSNLSSRTDTILLTLQFLTLVSSIGLVVTTIANTFIVVSNKRNIWSKIWAVVLLCSAMVIFWVVVAYHLAELNVAY